ncbi:sushi, von Willebrand factor type A, EGF and pentraxin domain-containing protein 1-like, partial [Physella acuta]|uniref:sushi, von Willebrand factor type A, EGF and pentraxin domain-containing protein 1-like n=1 Tax=Physella acuta TaxID=109671 RepID=UPI0027DBE430
MTGVGPIARVCLWTNYVIIVCLMTRSSAGRDLEVQTHGDRSWIPLDYNYDTDDEIENEIPCADPSPIPNGETIVWGDRLLLEYRCKQGYTPVGITHGACDLSTGKWTIDPPVCTDSGCPELTPPKHGVVNIDSSGGLATIVCRPGYFLLGDSTLVCEESKWKGSYPVCAVTTKPNDKTKSRPGENTVIKRSPGMGNSLDDSDETCFYNHIVPPEIEHAVVETSYVLNEIRHRYVMVATYTCMGGFKLRNRTNNQLFCKAEIWSAPGFPECIADDDPCEVDNGGCQHYCTPQGDHKHACSCYGGYNLASDGKACRGKDTPIGCCKTRPPG